jgi:hypothetical protein
MFCGSGYIIERMIHPEAERVLGKPRNWPLIYCFALFTHSYLELLVNSIQNHNPEIITLLKRIEALFGEKVYLYGGSVRDAAMNSISELSDYDICCALTQNRIRELLDEKGQPFRLKSNGNVTCFVLNDVEIDISTFTQPTLKDHLGNCDFDINSMVITSDGHIIDHWGGVRSILNREVHFLKKPEDSVHKNYVRPIRLIRFAISHNLSIDHKEWAQAVTAFNAMDLSQYEHDFIGGHIDAKIAFLKNLTDQQFEFALSLLRQLQSNHLQNKISTIEKSRDSRKTA